MPTLSKQHDPKSKAEFLNRILSFDFSGDIREIGTERAMLTRLRGNALKVTFPASRKEFEIVVRMPRKDMPRKDKAPGVSGVAKAKSQELSRFSDEFVSESQIQEPKSAPRKLRGRPANHQSAQAA